MGLKSRLCKGVFNIWNKQNVSDCYPNDQIRPHFLYLLCFETFRHLYLFIIPLMKTTFPPTESPLCFIFWIRFHFSIFIFFYLHSTVHLGQKEFIFVWERDFIPEGNRLNGSIVFLQKLISSLYSFHWCMVLFRVFFHDNHTLTEFYDTIQRVCTSFPKLLAILLTNFEAETRVFLLFSNKVLFRASCTRFICKYISFILKPFNHVVYI